MAVPRPMDSNTICVFLLILQVLPQWFSLFSTSLKPSKDLFEASLKVRTQSVQWLARSIATIKKAYYYFIGYPIVERSNQRLLPQHLGALYSKQQGRLEKQLKTIPRHVSKNKTILNNLRTYINGVLYRFIEILSYRLKNLTNQSRMSYLFAEEVVYLSVPIKLNSQIKGS